MQREYQILLTLMQLIEGALAKPVFVPSRLGRLETEHVPSVMAASVVPAAGGTLIERPALLTVFRDERPKGTFLPDDILEGFEVKQVGDKVVVGAGKYRKDGEVKEFAGAEVSLPPPNFFVAFNLLTEQVEVTMYLTPFHRVLK